MTCTYFNYPNIEIYHERVEYIFRQGINGLIDIGKRYPGYNHIPENSITKKMKGKVIQMARAILGDYEKKKLDK